VADDAASVRRSSPSRSAVVLALVIVVAAFAIGGYVLYKQDQRVQRMQADLVAQESKINAQTLLLQIMAKPDPRMGQAQLDITQLRSEVGDIESCLSSIGIQPAFATSWNTFGATC
jgi:uncharacterized protein HemX